VRESPTRKAARPKLEGSSSDSLHGQGRHRQVQGASEEQTPDALLSHDWLVAPGSEVVPPRSRLTHDYLLRMDVIQLGLATCGSKRGSSVTIRLAFGLATIS
jgi:hypothetical protein